MNYNDKKIKKLKKAEELFRRAGLVSAVITFLFVMVQNPTKQGLANAFIASLIGYLIVLLINSVVLLAILIHENYIIKN